MAPRCRKGFTLVELLVVIVIISMLAGLSIPAIMGARARARQNTCLNNQAQLGKAILGYSLQKKELPGWRMKLQTGKNTFTNVSWAVPLLPYMGEKSLWDQNWRNPNIALADKHIPNLELLQCPDDYSTVDGPLSYAVNCGWWGKKDTGDEFQTHYGLFVDKGSNSDGTINAPRKSVLIEQIKDGAGNTALLVENHQACVWAVADGTNAPDYLGLTSNDAATYLGVDVDDQRPGGVGVVWVANPDQCGNSKQKPVVWPNACLTLAEDARADDLATGTMYARGSSKHAGGLHVTYADGSVKFISDTISRKIYRSMLKPNDTQDDKAIEGFEDLGW